MTIQLSHQGGAAHGLPVGCGHYGDFYGTLYSRFDQEHRTAGSSGLSMLKVAQGSHETSDPGIGQIVFRAVTSSKLTHSSVDFGDRRRELSGRRNTFYLAPADAVADWRGEGDHEVMLLAAPVSLVHRLTGQDELDAGPDPLAPLYGREFMDERLTAMMMQIWAESARGGAGARLTVDGLFMMLLGRLSVMASGAALPGLRSEILPLDQTRLSRVMEFIDANLDKRIGVDELATVACMSPFHFARRFREAANESPHRFVRQRRIEKGARLLASTDMALSSVALDCGFGNQSHFTSAFTAMMGMPPGRYRAMNRDRRC